MGSRCLSRHRQRYARCWPGGRPKKWLCGNARRSKPSHEAHHRQGAKERSESHGRTSRGLVQFQYETLEMITDEQIKIVRLTPREEFVETRQFVSQEQVHERVMQHTVAFFVPQVREGIMQLTKLVLLERRHERDEEPIVDGTVLPDQGGFVGRDSPYPSGAHTGTRRGAECRFPCSSGQGSSREVQKVIFKSEPTKKSDDHLCASTHILGPFGQQGLCCASGKL